MNDLSLSFATGTFTVAVTRLSLLPIEPSQQLVQRTRSLIFPIGLSPAFKMRDWLMDIDCKHCCYSCLARRRFQQHGTVGTLHNFVHGCAQESLGQPDGPLVPITSRSISSSSATLRITSPGLPNSTCVLAFRPCFLSSELTSSMIFE